MGRPKKTRVESNGLRPPIRAILERTRKARAEKDKLLVGFVDDDPTPVMVIVGPRRRGRKDEQSEEPETLAVAPAERAKRATKTAKAREKRAANRKADRARQAEIDKALDDYVVRGASVAREVVESLKPVMAPPTSLRGVRVG